jgi:hypothetical protein
MIPMWKGKNPIYFEVIRSKVTYYKYNFWQRSFPHNNFSSVYWIFNKYGHMIPPVEGEEPYLFWGRQRSRSPLL